MPLEGGPLLVGGQVPEPDSLVAARRCQGLAIRAKGHAIDRMSMPLKGGPLGGGHVPDLDGHVMARRRQGLAIWAECHGVDMESSPLEGGPYLAGGHVPQLDV